MIQAFFPLPKTIRACVTAGAALAAMTAASSGQDLILNIDFADEPGDQVSTAADFAAAGISGGEAVRGPGLAATSAANSISSSGWDTLNPAEDYFSFTFSVEPGFSLDLSELAIGTRSSNTGPGDLGLFYNGDGFTQNLYTFTQSGTAFLNSQVDLSSLTGLTGEVEFRVIALSDTRADGATGISSAGTLRITNYFDGGDTGGMTFYGTVIPEPSTYAAIFGALALAGAFVWRRRKAAS